MKAKLEVFTLVVCPECQGYIGQLDRIGAQTTGASSSDWFCRACGKGYVVTRTELNEAVLELSKDYYLPTLSLLKLAGMVEEKPVYCVVEGHYLLKDGEVLNDATMQGHKAFYYDQHTCPTNWFQPVFGLVGRETFVLAHGANCDPHGLFQHVQTIRKPTEEQYKAMGFEGGEDEVFFHVEFASLQMLFSALRGPSWKSSH